MPYVSVSMLGMWQTLAVWSFLYWSVQFSRYTPALFMQLKQNPHQETEILFHNHATIVPYFAFFQVSFTQIKDHLRYLSCSKFFYYDVRNENHSKKLKEASHRFFSKNHERTFRISFPKVTLVYPIPIHTSHN
jgi:hypothetical protein